MNEKTIGTVFNVCNILCIRQDIKAFVISQLMLTLAKTEKIISVTISMSGPGTVPACSLNPTF